jgi:hypothetical protein
MQGLRREVHAAPPDLSGPPDEMPRVQKTSAAGVVDVQFTEGGFDIRREEGGIYGAEAGWEGRV